MAGLGTLDNIRDLYIIESVVLAEWVLRKARSLEGPREECESRSRFYCKSVWKLVSQAKDIVLGLSSAEKSHGIRGTGFLLEFAFNLQKRPTQLSGHRP